MTALAAQVRSKRAHLRYITTAIRSCSDQLKLLSEEFDRLLKEQRVLELELAKEEGRYHIIETATRPHTRFKRRGEIERLMRTLDKEARAALLERLGEMLKEEGVTEE